MPRRKAVLIGGSKGGIGKSSIAIGIALDLVSRGAKVGVLDADLDSPFLTKMLRLREGSVQVVSSGRNESGFPRSMVPLQFRGLSVMSFAAWMPSTGGTTLRGSFHEAWLNDAVRVTEWGDTELIIVDTPAGSSDELLAVRTLFGDDLLGMVVVAQPHLTWSLDRTWDACASQRMRILSVVANMVGPVFGTDAPVREWCAKRNLQYAGGIPLDSRIREAHERGEPLLPESLRDPIRRSADLVLEAMGRKVEVKT